MKKALVRIGLAAAAFGGFTTPVQAHEYQRTQACWNSGYWTPFINCDDTLNNGELVLAAERVLAASHTYNSAYRTLNCWCWVAKRINASAGWVRMVYPGESARKFQHVSLVDLDGYSSAYGGKPILVTEHYGDWPGAP